MTDHANNIRSRRSLLFVPGTRPDRFDSALGSGADMVCVDLEDAVPPGDKAHVRPDGVRFLSNAPDGPERVLRINSIRSAAGLADLLAVTAATPRGGVLMLPKVNSAADIQLVDDVLSEASAPLRLMALIETVEGLEEAVAIASASPRLIAVVFGAVDLSAELGASNAEGPMSYARGRVVHAARQARIGVIDVPELAFRDLDLVQAAAVRAADHGFTGKAAIHPSNIDTINAAFTPSKSQIAEALEAIAAFEAAPDGLAVVNGKLIEAPVIRTMRERLAIARAAGVV